MVKHSPSPFMEGFFTRERFGKPQFIAGLLLLAFLAQCVWLIDRGLRLHGLGSDELYRVKEGLRRWHGQRAAEIRDDMPIQIQQNDGYDPHHSALEYLITSMPLLVWSEPVQAEQMPYWAWLVRLPYAFFGVVLGASLWYVARRLYGNSGGYIALVSYCFSPAILRASSGWFAEPEVMAAWGAFGAIFTAMAAAHTLYAPREVVWWNWRRILLLGLSMALAIGCQLSLVVVIPLALGFMLYLAPTRRGAAVVIWAASCVLAVFLLWAAYFFHLADLMQALHHAHFFPVSVQAYGMADAYHLLWSRLGQASVVLVAALPLSILTYAFWRRARYFGNTAPLLVALLFLTLGLGMPHYPGMGFTLMAVPFLFIFVAGIASDLLETKHRDLVRAAVWGVLGATCLWNFLELLKAGQG